MSKTGAPGVGAPVVGDFLRNRQVRTMPDHTGFTRLSSSTMPDSLAVGPADLLEVTLQHALQSNAVTSLIALVGSSSTEHIIVHQTVCFLLS